MRAAIPGEERWWSVSGRPIHDEFGNFVGFRGSGTDLTEKRRSAGARLAPGALQFADRPRQPLPDVADAREDPRPRSTRPTAPARCCCSTSTASSRSTTRWATRPATRCSSRSPSGSSARPARPARSAGSAATSSRSSCPAGSSARSSATSPHEIIHALSQPYSIDGQRVVIGASVGIALSPDDGVTSEELIRNADLALYAAKDLGRGRFHFYRRGPARRSRSARAAWSRTCATRSPRASCSCTTSRSSRPRPRRSPASRRCCAGTIRRRAGSRPRSSSRSPRTPA